MEPTVESGMTTDVILSLGGNQGDRAAWLAFGVRVLAAHPRIRLTDASPIYKTEPVEVPDAYAKAWYFNQVVICETDLDVQTFSVFMHRVEQDAGRRRGDTLNLPRTLDIDLIAFGDVCLETPELTVPHPRARQRRFVLQPLADLRPDYRFPGDEESVREKLEKLPPHPEVLLVDAHLAKTKESAKWNYPF